MQRKDFLTVKLAVGERALLTTRALEAGHPNVSAWIRHLVGLPAAKGPGWPKGQPRKRPAP